MIEEILPQLFRIEIPLPNNPLKSLNSYLVKGHGRSLIIDTGMNRVECKNEMISSLEKLDVDLEETDFYITHLHVDHLGLASTLATGNSRIYFNETEAAFISHPERWQEAYDFYLKNGFPENELKDSMESHPGKRYGSRQAVTFSIVKEGDFIETGNYRFSCIETPGHSPGHMCLYEAGQKILVSGDHILFDITPNITHWPGINNSLQRYLQSLDKVSALDVKLVLPGHRNINNYHRTRIEELKKHHDTRAGEILSILKYGKKSAFDIAPYISWDIKYDSWEEFPPAQKWFAVGETIAHLEYLEGIGKIKGNIKDHIITFSLAAEAG